jgi:poly(hydroxyalkanoate) depolymerase family esterase
MKSPLICAAIAALLACADNATAGPGGGDSSGGDATSGTMEAVPSFGANPGALNMHQYIPEGLADGAPMVLVLHGCTQTAPSMVPAGWNALADQHKFAVVYAEQTSANNPVTCFNWAGEYGDPANLIRGQGENQSLASMAQHMIATHAINPDRVYISGFSAGGAMAAVMLATWPDLFAAGAIQSGVPYYCASTVQGATDCQQAAPARDKTAAEWGQLVRDANPGYAGRLPRVSLWHGGADTFIVNYANLTELTEQWTDVHGLTMTPDVDEEVAGARRSAFVRDGRTLVETYLVPGMGHATAMGADDPEIACALDGFAQYFEDKGICSTGRIARFFGLTGEANPDPGCDPGAIDCGGSDAAAPTVNIADPQVGTVVSGMVSVVAEASDDVGVDRVEFFVDGRLQATARTAPFTFQWPTQAFAEGEHALMAMAYDAAGNVAVDDDTGVMVDNDGSIGGFSGCSAASRSTGAAAGSLVVLFLWLLWRRRCSTRGRELFHCSR